MVPVSLYLHIPFCRHKCSYCDFNTYAGLESLMDRYVEALGQEARLLARGAPERLAAHTIYLGGGTPSLLSEAALASILDALDRHFAIESQAEITLEANPETLSLPYLSAIHTIGVNRLSLGMQSAQPQDLTLLERQHGLLDVVEAVGWARQAGMDNLNLDLIFGLPYQTLDHWQDTLEKALALYPDHLSLYALTLEHGTPLQGWVGRGLVSTPDADLAAGMYEWAAERLAGAGFLQYEISNWARQGSGGELRSCRHNLQYWRNRPYAGLGAGSHGYLNGTRTANVSRPESYIRRVLAENPEDGEYPRTPATVAAHPLDRYTEMQETLLMGFRLTREGVARSDFLARFGRPMEQVFPSELASLIDGGLLEWSGEGEAVLRLTRRGRLLGNQVFIHFV